MSRIRYPREILDAIAAQAKAAYPSECCGMLSGVKGRRGVEIVALHEMENVYDRYREVDPEAYPRTSRTAYLMEPRLQTRLMTELEKAGTPVVGIYHSHIDAGAYFSEEDQRGALWDDEPLHPGVEYLVMSVREGDVDAACSFVWDGKRFAGRDVKLEGE
jgi:[CysO sulfur-carrier protein]-S-L-cysteine hydrolase